MIRSVRPEPLQTELQSLFGFPWSERHSQTDLATDGHLYCRTAPSNGSCPYLDLRCCRLPRVCHARFVWSPCRVRPRRSICGVSVEPQSCRGNAPELRTTRK